MVEAAEATPRPATPWSARAWTPLAVYATVLLVLLLLSWQTTRHLSLNPRTVRRPFAGDWFFSGWSLWDGGWYRQIAVDGYSYVPGRQSSVAFFPGYPLTIRVVGRAIDNIVVGGILTTIVCGCLSLTLFWRWCRHRLAGHGPLVALELLAVYPFSVYLYGALYADALFLLLALTAFFLLEHDHPVWAGLAGAAATGTRLVGVAVAVGLVLRALERSGALTDRSGSWRVCLDRSKVRHRDLGVLMSGLGLIAWMSYLWRQFDDPLLFLKAQEAWGQGAGPRTWFKVALLDELRAGEDLRYAVGCVVQGAIALGALATVPAVRCRFGVAYAAYVLVLIAVPAIGSQDFQGLGRYAVAAFPVFALVGERLAAHPWAARRVLVVSSLLLAFNTVLLAKGQYIA